MKKGIILLLLFSLVTQSGCWDRNEIDELGFVMAVAMDPVENEEKDQDMYNKEKMEERNSAHMKRFDVTYQVAIPGQMVNEVGGTGEQPFFNITSSDMTNFKTIRNISSRRSRGLFFRHLKAIIINEELVRDGWLPELLDLYIRDHEMTRRTRVLISNGKARDIIAHKLPLEDMPAISIDFIRENNDDRVMPMIKLTELGQVSAYVIGERSYLLSRIVKKDEPGLKVAGAALFSAKTNEMAGWLGEEDVSGYNWIIGEVQNGLLEVPYKDNGLFVYESTELDNVIKHSRKDGINHFDIVIKSEGVLSESWIPGLEPDDAAIAKLEMETEEEIVRQANNIMEKMQSEHYADIFDLWKKVKTGDYRYWNETKDHWDGENGGFSKAEVTISADVKIRHYMLNKTLE